VAQDALRARRPCRPRGARLREVDGAHARADVDEAYQRACDLDADRRLRLLRGATNVRRQDDVGQALQLCARGAAPSSRLRPGGWGVRLSSSSAWLLAAAARPRGRTAPFEHSSTHTLDECTGNHDQAHTVVST